LLRRQSLFQRLHRSTALLLSGSKYRMPELPALPSTCLFCLQTEGRLLRR
jgi:hypothetical protein